MKNFKTLMTAVSLMSVASGTQASLEGIFYVDLEQAPRVLQSLKEIIPDSDVTKHFETDIMKLGDRGNHTYDVLYQNKIRDSLYNHGILKNFADLTQEGHNIRNADYTFKSADEIDAIVRQYIDDKYEGEERGQKLARYKAIVAYEFKQSYDDYKSWCHERGRWAEGVFDTFVCEIMGIRTWEATSYSPNFWKNLKKDNSLVFDVMKETGFLRTGIQSLDGYVYDAGLNARSYLGANSGIDTLVLGCGHFPTLKPREFKVDGVKYSYHSSDEFYGKNFESSCGHCLEAPHTGQAVLSAITTDNPDILGDVYDQKLWDGVDDDRLRTVSDHGDADFFRITECDDEESTDKKKTLAVQVARVLCSGGQLEVAQSNMGEEGVLKNGYPKGMEHLKTHLEYSGFVPGVEGQHFGKFIFTKK